MKKQHRQNWEQLDLQLPDKRPEQNQNLDLEIRREITGLIRLLLVECARDALMTKGGGNEQNQR